MTKYTHIYYLYTKINLFNLCSRCFLPESSKLAACPMNAAYSLLSSPKYI